MQTPDPPSDDYSSVNRRRFFRAIFQQGLQSLENQGKRVSDAVQKAFDTPTTPETSADQGPTTYLRPPGALSEAEFADTCSQCGKCVEACPADCIGLEPNVAHGLPHIVARHSPCIVCDDLSCMKACPTAALRLVDRIDMGTAVVDHQRCLRTDEDCRQCVQQCPVGQTALGFDDEGKIEVRNECIGCGVCEWVCPTQPASIIIQPTLA